MRWEPEHLSFEPLLWHEMREFGIKSENVSDFSPTVDSPQNPRAMEPWFEEKAISKIFQNLSAHKPSADFTYRKSDLLRASTDLGSHALAFLNEKCVVRAMGAYIFKHYGHQGVMQIYQSVKDYRPNNILRRFGTILGPLILIASGEDEITRYLHEYWSDFLN
jgi:hypothetical protein